MNMTKMFSKRQQMIDDVNGIHVLFEKFAVVD